MSIGKVLGLGCLGLIGMSALLGVFASIGAQTVKDTQAEAKAPQIVKQTAKSAKSQNDAPKELSEDQKVAYMMARMWAKEHYDRPNLEFPTSTDEARVKVKQEGAFFTIHAVAIEDDPFKPQPVGRAWGAKIQKGRNDAWRLVKWLD